MILVVSDWEPYLGSLGFALDFVGDCSCLCVVLPDRLYYVTRFVFCIVISCVTFFIKVMNNHYAAFRSDSLSTNEE